MAGLKQQAPKLLTVRIAADLRSEFIDQILGPMSHRGSIQGCEVPSQKLAPGLLACEPAKTNAAADAGPAQMMVLLWVALTAPMALYLVFGLMHVLLPPPYDKKALAILKLRPNIPTQIISLIRSMLQK